MNRRDFTKLFALGAIASASPLLMSFANLFARREADRLKVFYNGAELPGSAWRLHPNGIGEFPDGRVFTGRDLMDGAITSDKIASGDIQIRSIASIDETGRYRVPRKYTVKIKTFLS